MTNDLYGRSGATSLLGSSKITGVKDRLGGGIDQARTGALDAFGRAVDAVEGQIHRAPAEMQPAARKAIAFSRERPMATMLGLAAAALLLARGGRRR